MFNLKTSKIGRWINQNRIGVMVTVLAIALVILMLQVLNQSAKNNKRKAPTQNVIEESSKTIIAGSNVSEEKNKENTNTIDTFFHYCNSKNIDGAYDLLSKECKEELYPTIEDFKNYYYDKVFDMSKSYDMQSWISNGDQYTYKVKILDDMLATGQYNNSEIIEDYFTIIKEDEQTKLNINSYIGQEEINHTKEEKLKKVTIVKKQMYMDYEIYTIQIENNSNYDIVLDSKESIKNLYLLGENETEYSSYIDEITLEDLVVKAKESKTIEMKFNKMYNPSVKIEAMVFSDIIQDYDIYTALTDKNKYGGRLKLKIDL